MAAIEILRTELRQGEWVRVFKDHTQASTHIKRHVQNPQERPSWCLVRDQIAAAFNANGRLRPGLEVADLYLPYAQAIVDALDDAAGMGWLDVVDDLDRESSSIMSGLGLDGVLVIAGCKHGHQWLVITAYMPARRVPQFEPKAIHRPQRPDRRHFFCFRRAVDRIRKAHYDETPTTGGKRRGRHEFARLAHRIPDEQYRFEDWQRDRQNATEERRSWQ